jgi:hypothetical protein
MTKIVKNDESIDEGASIHIDDSRVPLGDDPVASLKEASTRQTPKMTVRTSQIRLVTNLAALEAANGLKATVTISVGSISITFEKPSPEPGQPVSESGNPARAANRPGQPVAKSWN